MRKLVNSLRGALFFFLCFAQVPLIAGHLLLGDSRLAVILLAIIAPCAFALALLPGHVGGGPRDVAAKEFHRGGSDPDPDKSLRSAAMPAEAKRAFPLRATVGFLAAFAAAFTVAFAPLPVFSGVELLPRCGMGAILGAMIPIGVAFMGGGQTDEARVSVTGLVLYAVAGAVAYFIGVPALNTALLVLGCLFVVAAALSLNSQALKVGAAVREGVKPAATLRRRNRAILIVFAAILTIVATFDKLRHFIASATQWLARSVIYLFMLLSNLFVSEGTGSGDGSGGGSDSLGALPAGEASSFWLFMEKVAIVLAIVAGAFLLALALKKLWKLISRLSAKLAARFKSLAAGMGEDYQDERESLLDWGDVQRNLSETVRKRLNKLFAREKKWEQLDARERVRFVARSLYRRARGVSGLASMTISEASEVLPLGDVKRETLVKLYDKARYSPEAPSEASAEELKKEARV